MASCLIETERTFDLEAVGRTKPEAFGKAFSGLQRKAYDSLKGRGLLIYMEPLAVEIRREHFQDTKEKLRGFFSFKPIMHYQVELSVTVKMRYVPMNEDGSTSSKLGCTQES